MNDDPKVISAVFKRKLAQYPVGREFIYLGINMRVTKQSQYWPPTMVPVFNLYVDASPAELHADYVDASGEICAKKFIGHEILTLD
jgi:hypothetical protein